MHTVRFLEVGSEAIRAVCAAKLVLAIAMLFAFVAVPTPPSLAARLRHTSVRASKAARCTSYAGPRLYVTTSNQDGQFVAIYKSTAQGNAKPICTVRNSAFSGYVGGTAVDAAGNLWIINSKTPAVMVVPYGSNLPVQTIAGSKTLLASLPAPDAERIAIDKSGEVWVPVWYGYNAPKGYVVAFAPDANGNVSPVQEIGYGLKDVPAPVAVAFDSAGNLYVSEDFAPGRVQVFSPPFIDGSTPVATWTMPQFDNSATYLCIDSHDNVYVGSYGEVDVFIGGLRSNGIVGWTLYTPNKAQIISGIACGPKNRLFAGTIQGVVDVFAPKATLWQPLRELSGVAPTILTTTP